MSKFKVVTEEEAVDVCGILVANDEIVEVEEQKASSLVEAGTLVALDEKEEKKLEKAKEEAEKEAEKEAKKAEKEALKAQK